MPRDVSIGAAMVPSLHHPIDEKIRGSEEISRTRSSGANGVARRDPDASPCFSKSRENGHARTTRPHRSLLNSVSELSRKQSVSISPEKGSNAKLAATESLGLGVPNGLSNGAEPRDNSISHNLSIASSKSEGPSDGPLLRDLPVSTITKPEVSEAPTKAADTCVAMAGEHMAASSPVPGTKTPSNAQRFRLGALLPEPQDSVMPATENTYLIANTAFVHPVRGHKRLYVGSEDVIWPPPQHEQKWALHVKPRLQTDIEAFKQNIKKKIKMEPDIYPRLRMSGYANRGSSHVTLYPQIWVYYSDRGLKKKVERFVKKLEWLPCEGFGNPIVDEGPRFGAFAATNAVEVALEHASAFHISEDLFLHLHCEGGEPVSPCGLICCATFSRKGEVQSQRLFRIGGLVSVNGAMRGLTTAHGMLEELWRRCVVDCTFDEYGGGDSHDDDNELDSDDSDSESISLTTDDEEDDDQKEEDEILETDKDSWKELIGSRDPHAVKVWNTISGVDAVSFLGINAPNLKDMIRKIVQSSSVSMRKDPSSTETATSFQRPDSDVSVWQIEPSQVPDRNIYYTKNGSDQIINDVDMASPEDAALEGSVQILIRWDNPVEGKLVPGISHFSLYGRVFETRKIRTPTPIAQGCSGSWVVQMGHVCGAIIASYDKEPYVHIVTWHHLVQDIKAASGPTGGSVDISLWNNSSSAETKEHEELQRHANLTQDTDEKLEMDEEHVHRNHWKSEEVEAMHRRVLDLTKIRGREHPSTLDSMNSLAIMLNSQGKYSEAEKLHQQTVELREKVLGREHPSTLNSLNNLAITLNNQGKYLEAERMHRQTLKLKEEVLGQEHPSTLESMNNLANVLGNQGKYSEAEQMHRQELELCKTILGREHPSTLDSMNNLALILGNRGKYLEAEQVHRQTLELKEKMLGREHPSTIDSINNLAFMLEIQEKYLEAEQMQRQELELCEMIRGREHPSTLDSMNNLAITLNSQKKYTEAEKMHREILELREKLLGREHPSTLDSMNNLALVYHDQGKYHESEKMQRRELELCKKIRGQEHPSTLESMHNLARVLQSQRKYSEAEQMLRQTLQLREKVLGHHHPSTIASRISLRACLMAARNRTGALTSVVRAA